MKKNFNIIYIALFCISLTSSLAAFSSCVILPDHNYIVREILFVIFTITAVISVLAMLVIFICLAVCRSKGKTILFMNNRQAFSAFSLAALMYISNEIFSRIVSDFQDYTPFIFTAFAFFILLALVFLFWTTYKKNFNITFIALFCYSVIGFIMAILGAVFLGEEGTSSYSFSMHVCFVVGAVLGIVSFVFLFITSVWAYVQRRNSDNPWKSISPELSSVVTSLAFGLVYTGQLLWQLLTGQRHSYIEIMFDIIIYMLVAAVFISATIVYILKFKKDRKLVA